MAGIDGDIPFLSVHSLIEVKTQRLKALILNSRYSHVSDVANYA